MEMLSIEMSLIMKPDAEIPRQPPELVKINNNIRGGRNEFY